MARAREKNEDFHVILLEMMDMEGARCELAANGQEAVEMFLRSEPEYYDMILMDVQMPVMNGYEAARKIRACGHPRAGSIPIVAMTANAFAEDVRNALDPIFADDPELLARLNKNEITYADIPAVRDMVDWLAAAKEKGWFGENYAGRDWDGLSRAMASGECVMIHIWDTWFDTDLEEGGTYSKEDFALMPVFMNTAPSGTYEGGNLNMMMVNKQGGHVEEALGSISLHQRASTANPKITGYTQQEMGAAVEKLFRGEVDAAGCAALMDEYRMAAARDLGAEGFGG